MGTRTEGYQKDELSTPHDTCLGVQYLKEVVTASLQLYG